jgi:glycosyltransferase involved in cell wall biosynthesis
MTVSVVVPTYNRATLLVEAVDSVLDQSYRDFEIIIVDDGSTDDTEQRIRNYSDKIVYIKQQNSGVNVARHRALGVAQGEYIALLDNDDLWFDFKLELQVKLLKEYQNVGFVFSDFLIRKETGGEIHGGLSTWHRYRDQWIDILPSRTRFSASGKAGPSGLARFDFDVYHGDVYHASLFEPYVLPSTALIRRRCIDPDIRLVDHDPTCGDWDFFARLSHRHSALYMDIETAVNRSHEDEVRLTRLPQSIQIRRRLDMIDRIWAADRVFCELHGHDVEMVKNELWIKLAKHQAMAGDITGARESLSRRTQTMGLRTTLTDDVIAIMIRLPGASSMLKFMSWMRFMLRPK